MQQFHYDHLPMHLQGVFDPAHHLYTIHAREKQLLVTAHRSSFDMERPATFRTNSWGGSSIMFYMSNQRHQIVWNQPGGPFPLLTVSKRDEHDMEEYAMPLCERTIPMTVEAVIGMRRAQRAARRV